eukprot:984126-Pyramimonas_sp.AAC.1
MQAHEVQADVGRALLGRGRSVLGSARGVDCGSAAGGVGGKEEEEEACPDGGGASQRPPRLLRG